MHSTLPTSTSRRWLFRPPPAQLFRPPSKSGMTAQAMAAHEPIPSTTVGHTQSTQWLRSSVARLTQIAAANWSRFPWHTTRMRLQRTWRQQHHWLVSALVVSLFSQLISPNFFGAAHPIYAAEPDAVVVSEALSTPAVPLVGPVAATEASPQLQSLWGDFASMIIAEAKVAQTPDLYDTFRGEPKLQNPSQDFGHLPPTQAYMERYRPADDWLDIVERKPLSPIYAPVNEYWREDGRILKIEDGFVITRIPERMAPMYEYVEQLTGVSRYILMAVATIESKQGISTRSGTNCQGWGHFCPGTINLFEGKDLLPENFDTYDTYDGILGIAIHLRVSSLGTGAFKALFKPDTTFDTVGWPDFWNGETPDIQTFERNAKNPAIVPAAWGYNRSAFYGYSVAHLAKFYQDRDVLP